MTIVPTTSNAVKENPVTFQCLVLASTNYTTWAIKMEATMDAQGLWESIKPAVGVVMDEKKSKMARAFIFQLIPEDILMQARLHTLKSKFEALRVKDGESIDEYAGKLSGMISKYNSVGATLNDEELVKASTRRVDGENSLLLTKAEGQTMNQQNSKAPGGRGRGWNGDRGGRGGTRGGRGSGRGRDDRYGKKPSQKGEHWNRKPRDKSHIKCFECQQLGHYASECMNKKKPEQEVHLMTKMEEQTLMLCVKGEDVPSTRTKCFLNCMKVETVAIKTCGLTSNIFSLGQLTEVGYDVWLYNEYLKVYNEQGTLVLQVQRSSNTLYKMALKVAKPACFADSLVDDAWTWHARFGHANFYTLEMIGKKRMLTGMPCVSHPKQLCNGCVVAKQSRCRYMWVYLLRSKDEELAKFKIFKAQVETETEYKVKVLRIDQEASLTLKPLSIIVREKELKGKPRHCILRNKTALWSEETECVPVNDTVPFDAFDDTPVRGTYLIREIYQRAPRMTEEEVQDQYQQAGLLLLNKEPSSFQEATKETQWMEAMRAEIDSIEKNRTWTLTRLPPNQKKGVDIEDAFALVARMESIWLLLALVAKENWIVHHLDVKSAFLNGELKEEVYLTQPIGFEVKGKEEIYISCTILSTGYNKHLALGMQNSTKYRNLVSEEVKQEEDSIVIKQENYARKILKAAGMSKCNPTKWHMDPKLQLTKDEGGKEVDPTNSHASDIKDRRGTTGMVFYYSQNPVTWASLKQQTVALSSCEAEFMAATTATCQALWLRNMVSFLTGEEAQRVQLLVDNQSAIALMKNHVFHGRGKHIDTKYHFIRECVERD
nr:hypothetical protein [Tanacetum cinerariifolium]